MKTQCRIDGPAKYIIKNIDGRKETFNAMWITRGGKLAGAKFQRCPRNKNIATIVDGPYYLRVLPVRKYVKGAKPLRKENAAIPTPVVVQGPITYDVHHDGTVDIKTNVESSFILKTAARKREFKCDV